jgi:arsenate reductase
MTTRYNVMFLCTGSSARSTMAEAIISRKGAPHFTAYSAGSHPAGFVRSEALRQIEAAGLSTGSYYSKSWEEFAKAGAPRLNLVFTVCDNAAKEIPFAVLNPRRGYQTLEKRVVIDGSGTL